jgi:hypothetical protein
MGMSRPVHVIQRDTEVEEIVNVVAIAVVDSQETDVRVVAELGKSEMPSIAEEHTPPLEPSRR